MKFLRTLKRIEKKVEHKDHYIEKCGECPELIAGQCIRKKVFVSSNRIYEKCPLPEY